MSDKFMYILSQDDSDNVIVTSELVTTTVHTSRIGMWGEGMFGSVLTLGAGFSNTYETGFGTHVQSEDFSLNVIRLPVRLWTSVLTSQMSMWGMARFGAVETLGSGFLSEGEG